MKLVIILYDYPKVFILLIKISRGGFRDFQIAVKYQFTRFGNRETLPK